MSTHRFLVMTRSAPYGTSAARDALETALTCSVFEQPVTLLFLDDGVFQLLKGQAPAPIEQKNLNAMQQSLPLYDIERLCVSRRALELRGLSAADLILPVELIDDAALPALLAQHDTVLSI
ncbi:MAG: sulfurtransferase complex subunit TusC [Oceanospirillaceae bacterium]|nr:sulfurtransferase complex subunit TusC [Oceanospirillaceae bacterium]